MSMFNIACICGSERGVTKIAQDNAVNYTDRVQVC